MANIRKTIFDYIWVTIGCFIYAFGFYAFINAANITTGGVTGFVNVLNMVHPIPIGVVTMLINVPLLIASIIVFKWRFTISTLYGTVVSSVFISMCEMLLNPYLPFINDILLSALVGGTLAGAGLGMTMRWHSSTGGVGIAIKLLHKKWRHLSGGTIHAIIDAIILIFFFCVTRNFESTIYALITIIISNIAYDLILYGINTTQTVYIITNHTDTILPVLSEQYNCMTTVWHTNEQTIILSIIKKQLLPIVKDAICQSDNNAFIIVSKSTEIYGDGFKDYKDILS